jgi:hypothetical protein
MIARLSFCVQVMLRCADMICRTRGYGPTVFNNIQCAYKQMAGKFVLTHEQNTVNQQDKESEAMSHTMLP